MKKILKRFLKTFIRIDRIPFTDNGKSAEYCTLFILGLAVASNVYPRANNQNSDPCQN